MILVVLVPCALVGCAGTGAVKPLRAVKDISEEKVLRSMAERPRFQTRKRFTYLMAWNGIPVGRIVAEIGDITRYRGRDVYVVKLVTESNKFLSRIYRVEDTYISYVDTVTITSRWYEADRKEGSYRKHLVVNYDFEKQEAIYTNLTDGSIKRCSIEENVQDPLSVICYFMTMPVKPGDKVYMTVNLNRKNYRVFSEVEKVNMIKLPGLGEFPAFRIRPQVELNSKRVKKGSAWMYFAADERRYPLYGAVLIPFGKVTATLRTVEDI